MNRKISFNIGEPIKILTGNMTLYDNAWAIETEDMYYYVHWCSTF